MATAIVILNYNTASDTISCIQSIEAYNTAPINYIVVDNGSSHKEGIRLLEKFFENSQKSYLKLSDTDSHPKSLPYFCFLVSSSNDGYARGNNKGLDLAYSDSSIQNILILNSDVLFCEDIIPTLVHIQDSIVNCGLITPLVLSRRGTIDHCCARKAPTNWQIIIPFLFFHRNWFKYITRADEEQKLLKHHPNLLKEPFFPIDIPSGACMLIKKDVLQSLGSFDPRTFLYFEENILEKKTKKAELVNYCVPSVNCIHLGANSTMQLSSIFLQKCSIDSADHYLRKYGKLSITQSVTWAFVRTLWKFKFILKKR